MTARGVLLDTLAGVIGGVLGSTAIGMFMEKQKALPDPLHTPALSENPAEHMLKKGERLLGKQVPPEHRALAGQVLHYAYGTLGPTLLGLIARKARLNRSVGRTVAVGAGLGLLVWAAGYLGWLPATRIAQPIERQGASHVATAIAGHAAYGVLAALPIAASGRLN